MRSFAPVLDCWDWALNACQDFIESCCHE
jgi:hypothetical protein